MSELAAADLLQDFALEAHERIGRVEASLLQLPGAAPVRFGWLLEQIRRDLHTLKGNSALVGLGDLQALAHEMEDLAEELAPGQAAIHPLLAGVDRFRAGLRAAGWSPEAPAGRPEPEAPAGRPEPEAAAGRLEPGAGSEAGSARIPFATIDGLIELLAEMVMFRNRLADGLARCRQPASPAWQQVEEAHQRLGSILDQIQAGILRLRMVPLRSLLGQLHRLVYDESEQQGKSVRLLTEGGDTPLDKGLFELAGEVLGHLVRNAVTHGIESPEERRQAGKAAQGTLRLAAVATSREVRIDVEDDGRGLRRDEIAAAAVRLGLPGAAAADPAQLVFAPGLSTRRSADLSAGRGIGLATVHAAVERRGGRIEVVSEEDLGSLFRLTLPLSASITRALLLRCDGELYALPMRVVVEGLRFRPAEVHEVNGAGVLRWRGTLLPALDLGCSFGTAPARRGAGYAAVIAEGRRQRALLVDEIQGARDVVVKTLDPLLRRAKGFAGSTVLGDGRAVLILDPVGLLDLPLFVEATA
jgi:two-component system chemotaxis sensor kinase CheA